MIENQVHAIFVYRFLLFPGDATLSRHTGIDIKQLNLQARITTSHSGDVWKGVWQGNEIVAKILRLAECTLRDSRDFKEEFPRLRLGIIFNF